MTSWITQRVPVKSKQPSFSYYFQTNQDGWGDIFYNYLCSAIYSQRSGNMLYVYDKSNNISDTFHILEGVISSHANVIFLKEKPSQGVNLMTSISQTFPILKPMSVRRLRRDAEGFFWFNRDAQQSIAMNLINNGIERTVYDIGVQIRSSKDIPIASYIDTVKKVQRDIGKKSLSIFVMTDSYSHYLKFKDAADPSWKVFTLATDTPFFAEGYNPSTFEELSTDERIKMYYHFLTELWVMQNITNLVVSYSSSVGRFLYLMNRHQENGGSMTSVDGEAAKPF